MPSEVKPSNSGAKPGAKKPMMGIPTWGWIAAIGIGLLIGYFTLRKSSSASAGTNDSGTSSSPLGANSGTGGGASSQASPPNTIPLVSTLTDPGPSSNGSGDSSTSTNPQSDPVTQTYTPPSSGTTNTAVIGGVGYEQSAPGSDYYQVVPLSEAAPPGTTNVHKPGLQM